MTPEQHLDELIVVIQREIKWNGPLALAGVIATILEDADDPSDKQYASSFRAIETGRNE